MRLTKLAGPGARGGLALTACGADGEAVTERPTTPKAPRAPAPDGETLRLWLNGEDVPEDVVAFLEERVREPTIRASTSSVRAAAVGRDRRAPDHRPVERRQPRRRRAGQHPGPRRSRPPAPWSTSPTHRDHLGGDDLLQSLVESGTYDGRFYGVPYYAGARIVVYRTDLLEAAGLEVPTTIDEFVEPASPSSTRTPPRRTSRASTSRAATGTPRSRSSGTPAATSPSRTATSGSASSADPSRSRG